MRFRAEQHLRRALDIQRVRQVGRRFDCGAFTLWWAARETPDAGTARVAVVASRASVGGAVQRNRAKRRLRELFRHHQVRVPPDVDLLLVARRSINVLEYRELETRFVRACAGLFPAFARDA